MDKKKLVITFSTHDGKAVSEPVKDNAERNINNWLSPVVNELNDAGAKVELYIDEFNIQHLTIDCEDKELQERAYQATIPYFPH